MLKYINNYKNYEEFFYDGLIIFQGLTKITNQNIMLTIFVRSFAIVKDQTKENQGKMRNDY